MACIVMCVASHAYWGCSSGESMPQTMDVPLDRLPYCSPLGAFGVWNSSPSDLPMLVLTSGTRACKLSLHHIMGIHTCTFALSLRGTFDEEHIHGVQTLCRHGKTCHKLGENWAASSQAHWPYDDLPSVLRRRLGCVCIIMPLQVQALSY